jgi:peptidoglycan/LPS O-acetylase OafA/YrhL
MPESPKQGLIRNDIQALRALAIVSVLLFHLWPNRFSGGFVGVDVFFVISGFLITGQLWREVEATGRVKFSVFWARRARRLLPASLLVIFATIATSLAFIPPLWFTKFFDEAVGSVSYFQNWVLAGKATDYLQGDTQGSPFLHFWSLSVEEQFYVFWPLLLGFLLLAVRFTRTRPKTAVVVGLTTIAVASFAYSVWLTRSQPELAFFSTFTRAWEFAAGALVAVVFSRASLGKRLRAIFLWAGLATIGYALVRFNTETAFPGYWAAVPVVGASLVLLGGNSSSRLAPQWVFNLWPIRFLGDISYSLYLWHWPLIILAPWIMRQNLTTNDRLVILASAILLGWLSKRFVEDPVRFGWISKQKIRTQLVAAALAMSFVIIAALSANLYARAKTDSSWSSKNLNPPLSEVSKDFAAIEETSCRVKKNEVKFSFCTRGDKNGLVRVGLFGDSHTRQYFEPLNELAKENHWQLVIASKSACPVADADQLPEGIAHESCSGWNRSLESFIESQPKFDLIINSTSTLVTGNFETASASYVTEVKRLVAKGNRWLVIVDNPKPLGSFLACIEAAGNAAVRDCSISRKNALTPVDRLSVAVRGLPGVTFADFTDSYCNETTCSPVIDKTVVYRDSSHITATFALTLKPRLAQVISDALKQPKAN